MTAEADAYEGLVAAALEKHPAMAAAILERAAPADAASLLDDATPDGMLQTIRHLSPGAALDILSALPDAAAKVALEKLDPNRAAALVARGDEETKVRLLGTCDAAIREELQQLMSYPPDSAGGLMNPRVTTFAPNATVGDVVSGLKTLRRGRIQDVFLIDSDGKLVGSVPLGEIVLAQRKDPLHSIATIPTAAVQAMAPREDVVSALEQHRGASLPVVDIEGRLLGVLRQEELLRAARRDAAANALAMVGASRDERALSPFTFAVRKRLPWLQINLLTAFLAAAVVGLFESTIAKYTALAVLLPVVAGQSGNTGAQALAVTMRGLTLREVRTSQWLRVATKEVLAGASNGVAVALTTGGAVFLWSSSAGLALVIILSMVCAMTAAGLAGAIIPMVLTALRQDPAQSSSIILTTVTDVVGFFSFLGIATLLHTML